MALPESTTDLFAKAGRFIPTAASPVATPSSASSPVITIDPKKTLGGILSAVLRDDPAIQKQLTAVEQSAIQSVIKQIGTPDEAETAAEYILRALPLVRSAYSSVDVISPIMPTDAEILMIMRDRFL